MGVVMRLGLRVGRGGNGWNKKAERSVREG